MRQPALAWLAVVLAIVVDRCLGDRGWSIRAMPVFSSGRRSGTLESILVSESWCLSGTHKAERMFLEMRHLG